MIPILYLIDYLHAFSGTERHLCELLSRLDKSVFQPYVVTFQGSQELKAKLESIGIDVRILNISRIYGVRQLWVFLQLRRFIKEQKIKIVQTFHTKPDLFGTALGRISGVPVIISSRRDMAFDRTTRELLLYRALNRYVDRIICVSHKVKDHIRNEENIEERKLQVIYNGIEKENFRQVLDRRREREKLGIGPRQKVVGVLASFNRIKGHRYFIDACPSIRQRFTEVVFLLVGDGPEEAALRRQVEKLGLGDCVRFLGYRTDTVPVLAAMDALVAPSLSEGFSNTLLEALYMKKPVVATRVGGNPEIIIDGKTGILVDPARADEIAGAVERIFADAKLARSLGEDGRKLVEERFIIGGMVEATQELYLRLLREKGLLPHDVLR